LVPIDNTTDGRIGDTPDTFIRLPQIRICSSTASGFAITAGRVANRRRCGALQQGPGGSQCRAWGKHFPYARLITLGSTTEAAKMAVDEPGAAAIASRQAAVNYGLRILFQDIEDSPNNETRFVVIGNQKCEKTGKDKTSVMFRVTHAAGALVEALEVFRQAKINLTWIESYPVQSLVGGKPQYALFVDFEGHAGTRRSPRHQGSRITSAR
jgi:chorismate mutase/prephenate dehydratase